ncbi:hypothetical protein [Haloarcula sp. Atlit-7R]|uniref:hypothetical protein n=1 Tax=Haloarcula sp. Atlit-7R TaxID=2282125 RepID=UPI000EF16135|nr:hypothetical protein [Haloarcula sp. Atlit-7R]RLM94316.1 hypothetical protein D3D01_15750 [Haloarcula sp. Atlit-7R]
MSNQEQHISHPDSSDDNSHTIEFTHVKVLVIDEQTGNPVPEAEVKFSPLDSESDSAATAKTAKHEQHRGMVEFKLAPRVKTGGITVSHDRYATTREKLDIQDGETETAIELEIGTGIAHLGCDGNFIDSLSYTITPDDEFLQERYGTDIESSETLPDDGIAEIELVAGDYIVEIEDTDPASYFKSSQIEFTVPTGETTSVNFEMDVASHLSADQETQIDNLRDSISSLRSKNRVDTAIQHYLSSVTEEAVDEVERCISGGATPVGTTVSPEEAQSALLQAINQAHVTLETILKGKRAVDLFTACNDKVDIQIDWNGSFDTQSWYYWLCHDRSWAQSEFREVKRETYERVTDESAELAEAGPLLDLIDEWELPADSDVDDIEYITHGYVLTQYLDAVAEMLNYPDLKKRFDETTY